MSSVDGVLMPVISQWLIAIRPTQMPANRSRADCSPAKVGAINTNTASSRNEMRNFCGMSRGMKNDPYPQPKKAMTR